MRILQSARGGGSGLRGHGGTAKNGSIKFYSKQAIIITECGLQALGVLFRAGKGGGSALEGMGAQRKNGSIKFYSKQAIIISECGLQALGCTL